MTSLPGVGARIRSLLTPGGITVEGVPPTEAVAEGDVGADSQWPLWVGSARIAVVGELGACVGVGGVSVRSGGGGAPSCRLSH